MTRYKGGQSAKAVEKDYVMYEFHAHHGIKPQRGHGRHDANGAVIRWCFADEEIAATFASAFDA
jgi:hypothetical protein